jgi:hypothetical protein
VQIEERGRKATARRRKILFEVCIGLTRVLTHFSETSSFAPRRDGLSKNRWFVDSPLEETRFELPVPLSQTGLPDIVERRALCAAIFGEKRLMRRRAPLR